MRNRVLAISQIGIMALLVGIAPTLHAQTFKFSTLYSFKNNGTDPTPPLSAPVADSAGNIYGNSPGDGITGGMIFKVTPGGVLSVLYRFPADQGIPGFPSMARDKAGNLYGSAYCSNNLNACIFKVTPAGVGSIVYTFTNSNESQGLVGPVTLDAAGNIYGPGAGGPNGGGLVFKIDTSGTYSVLYNFCSLPNCADGSGLDGNLVVDSAGNLYGTNANGVQNIFKLSPTGEETVLNNFHITDGSTGPFALRQDSHGNLYGLTAFEGLHFAGSIFKLSKSGGPITTLYSFCSKTLCADGQDPLGLVLDAAGNVFGTTFETNGRSGSTVWEYSMKGKEVTLYTFPRGVFMYGGLAIDATGNLYGFTSNGGTDKRGSVFKLTREP